MSTYQMKFDPSIDDLPARADAFLAEHPRPREAPFYREATFTRKLQGYRREIRTRKPPPEPPSFHQLLRREMLEIVEASGLDPVESMLVREHLCGLSLQLLGRSLGVSRQAAHERFHRAIEKIRACYAVYPYAGLAEAYRSELKRGKRPPSSGRMPD